MTIAFPDFYEGGFPDRELVMLDLTQKFLDLLTPTGEACTWLLPKHYEMVAAGRPVVRLYRGGLGAHGLWDDAAVQVGVIASTRKDSWDVLEYLRQMYLSFEHGGPVRREDGSITMLSGISEMVGPQQLPEINPDDRLVPATFNVQVRRPRSLPDYRVIRESLPL